LGVTGKALCFARQRLFCLPDYLQLLNAAHHLANDAGYSFENNGSNGLVFSDCENCRFKMALRRRFNFCKISQNNIFLKAPTAPLTNPYPSSSQ